MTTAEIEVQCPECGEDRIFSGNGLVCPRGHGKLISFPGGKGAFNQLLRDVHREELMAPLPEATKIDGTVLYTIAGMEGVFRFIERKGAEDTYVRDGHVHAKLHAFKGWYRYEMARDDAASAAIREALLKALSPSAPALPSAATFSPNDRVTWSSQAGGVTKEKVGLVEEVIPSGQVPRPGLGIRKGVTPRDHVSYTVLAGTRRYWPLASKLQRIEVDSPA